MDKMDFFAKRRIVAAPGFNRWLVPPAALAIHLCIGMAYGFSVYWLPMSQLSAASASLSCSAESSLWQQLFTSGCRWRISSLGWIYTLFFVFLGCSAAIWGTWLEKAGPRKVGFIATLCWCGGLTIASFGVWSHQLWLLWLGAGAIGGIGLGLGYISPVSTLLRWFPDRKGMAAGLAIMGFGGGAMIGAPLATTLMHFFSTDGQAGIWQSLLALAGIYFVFMLAGTLSYRIPPIGWQPENWQPASTEQQNRVQVHVNMAIRTPQFWLLWLVLCLNVSAGIGVLGMASPLFQEVMAGRLSTTSGDKAVDIAMLAAGFTGLLSLFNILGRFFWASLSDRLGRKLTFSLFFVLGAIFYLLIPFITRTGSIPLFLMCFCMVISMYGGGFATIPAYLADIFGARMVGAIHGRLLTAWSAAGIVGPVLINYLREHQLASGLHGAELYQLTLNILAGLLLLGLLCNLLLRPADKKYAMSEQEEQSAGSLYQTSHGSCLSWHPARSSWPLTVVSWVVVLIPLLWGISITLKRTLALFT
ncbi:OFA family MFS transporter [Erwinia phyllosphaerae]|uniref:OFA family MFS transporter n=1 Tax=Erwinia phyllosphaerae TaxID=2853256 RepID=UPI001FEEE967|nr:OFA family MFS transporter [Erwinia phyllosphaerae]MBV4368920.1 OFA family MFS transporter [Erwinia phyllosphaerae]